MSTKSRLVTMRPGTPADLPIVAGIMADAFDPQYGEAWTSAQCMGMLALPGVWLTLGVQEESLAGFALARVVAGDGELLLLGVRPAARGHGIGGALLRGVIAEVQARGGERLHLEVRAGNPAVALYRAHGFEKVGERRDYYRGNGGRSFHAQTFALSVKSAQL